MRSFGLALVLALAGSAVAAPGPGHKNVVAAQEADKKGDADAAHGRTADARAQWTNAAAAYQAAIDAGDDIAINVALASVEDKLGRFGDAYKHLQLVAHANVKPDGMKTV